MRIGLLGGTGTEARGLALRFARAAATVLLGSRSAERAASAAEEYRAIAGSALLHGMMNEEMIQSSEIIFITVPFQEARAALAHYRPLFSDRHILVDVTVPVEFRAGQPEYLDQDGQSNSEILAGALSPEVPLIAAFKTIPAHLLADLEADLDCDVFVCGDSAPAKARVMAAAAAIPFLRPLDAGPLTAARTLERMAVLAISLNRKYKVKGARFRIQGI